VGNYKRPTGRRPGRPSLVQTVSDDLKKSKSYAAKKLLGKLEAAEGQVPLNMIELSKDAAKEVANQIAQQVAYKNLAEPMVVVGETAADQADNAVSELLSRMHYAVPHAVQRALLADPKEFIRTYLDLVQYKIAKLSKQEVTGNVQHSVSMFVPVEARNLDSIPLIRDANGVHRAEGDAEG